MCVLKEEPELDVDYLAIRTPDLAEIDDPHPLGPIPARILIAARIGGTRLIDNMPLTLGGATLPATPVAPRDQ
jgi:pantoate--beta-alanine ligase